MNQVDPTEFIITRKRKKYRFALFANSPICFELDDWQQRDIDVLEVGAGTGLFSVELARQSPDKVFLALDVKADRLQKGAKHAEELGLSNVFFVRARADQINQVVRNGSLSEVWLTFPDPFPKKRSAGRRMSHSTFLNIYKRALRPKGSLLLKHDNQNFFCWSLEQLVSVGWDLCELTFDLHESNLKDCYKTLTTYEKKWLAEGAKIGFVRAMPKRTNKSIEIFKYFDIIDYMEQNKTVNVLKAMADETRLSIVHQLAQSASSVSRCDIVSSCSHALKLSQPAMSHHFNKLVDAGVILVDKQGTQNSYSLNKALLTSIGFDVTKL